MKTKAEARACYDKTANRRDVGNMLHVMKALDKGSRRHGFQEPRDLLALVCAVKAYRYGHGHLFPHATQLAGPLDPAKYRREYRATFLDGIYYRQNT